jgi:hypothetical protein
MSKKYMMSNSKNKYIYNIVRKINMRPLSRPYLPRNSTWYLHKDWHLV